MTNRRLEDYPHGVSFGSEMDMIASREYFGRGSSISGVRRMKLNSGKTLVYLEGQRDGQEIVETPFGFQPKLDRYNVICGYLKRKLFGLLKKVQPVSDEDRERVEEEFLRKIKPDSFGRMPCFVDFWGCNLW